ncbi:MAG TPA: hypothetical protein VGL40_13745 [Bacillota bacterium]|jgi:hypothetical protein
MARVSTFRTDNPGSDQAISGEVVSDLKLTINETTDVADTDLTRWLGLHHSLLTREFASDEAQEFAVLQAKMQAAFPKGIRWSSLKIPTNQLPFIIQDYTNYPLTITVGQGAQVASSSMVIVIQSLPTDSSWSPADLHIHSTLSDGSQTPGQIRDTLATKGYRIAYITDHTDLIQTKTTGWADYSSQVTGITGITASYPGAEFTVGALVHTGFGRIKEIFWPTV